MRYVAEYENDNRRLPGDGHVWFHADNDEIAIGKAEDRLNNFNKSAPGTYLLAVYADHEGECRFIFERKES
jgi:hypothetical protein